MRLPWRRTWVCPHCFRRMSRAQIAYVCASGAACADDRRLASADPRAGSAVCGTCGRTATRLRCTACAGRLPEGYLRTPGKLVALAGPVSSGKSTYIGVLVHELLHRLGAELDAALLPATTTRWPTTTNSTNGTCTTNSGPSPRPPTTTPAGRSCTVSAAPGGAASDASASGC